MTISITVKRRVARYLVATVLCLSLLPPAYMIWDMLSLRKRNNIPPRSKIPAERMRGVRIPLLQETLHPGVPRLAVLRWGAFHGGELPPNIVRPLGVEWRVPTQASGLLTANAVQRKADPPV